MTRLISGSPGGNNAFRVSKQGELFLFKLHSPHNFIVGGRLFTHSSILPVSLVWEAFGEKNGTATFGEMRAKILKYRGANTDPREDFDIGCILLQQPFFLPRNELDSRVFTTKQKVVAFPAL